MPKSCASPVDAMVTYSIVLIFDGSFNPPENTPLVEFATAPASLVSNVKSPNTTAVPPVEMVRYLILLAWDVLPVPSPPPPITPLMELEHPPAPLVC